MTDYNTCRPDPETTLGDFDLVGRLLVALNIAVIFWGSLVVFSFVSRPPLSPPKISQKTTLKFQVGHLAPDRTWPQWHQCLRKTIAVVAKHIPYGRIKTGRMYPFKAFTFFICRWNITSGIRHPVPVWTQETLTVNFIYIK